MFFKIVGVAVIEWLEENPALDERTESGEGKSLCCNYGGEEYGLCRDLSESFGEAYLLVVGTPDNLWANKFALLFCCASNGLVKMLDKLKSEALDLFDKVGKIDWISQVRVLAILLPELIDKGDWESEETNEASDELWIISVGSV